MKKMNFTSSLKYLCAVLSMGCLISAQACEEGTVSPGLHSVRATHWQQLESGTSNHLRDIWGVDRDHVIAVGDHGTILSYNGIEWSEMASGTDENLLAVWGSSRQNIYVTGENGTILRFDGMQWAPVASGTSEPIKSVWGWADERYGELEVAVYVLAGGSPGKVMEYDPWSGEFVHWRFLPDEPSIEFLNIQGFRSSYGYMEMCLTGRGGAAYFLDYNGWLKSETGTTDDLFSVVGDAPGYIYAVAENGKIYQNTKQWMEDPPTGTWRLVADLGGGKFHDIAARSYNDIFMVGAGPRIVHYDRKTFTSMAVNVTSTLRGVWADDTDVFAVGDDGVILTYSSPPAQARCPINVTISVTIDSMPVISWTPECPVAKLFVEDWGDNGYHLTWFIASNGNFIEPGVRIGTVPENATEFCPTGALLEGELYRVSLIRRDWDNEILIGSWNFIPSDSPQNGYMAVSPAEVRGADDWLARVSMEPQGYKYKKFFLLRVRQTVPQQAIFAWADVRIVGDGSWRWIGDPAEREEYLDIRPAIIEGIVIDPDTGLRVVISRDFYRIANLTYDNSMTVIWDIVRQ